MPLLMIGLVIVAIFFVLPDLFRNAQASQIHSESATVRSKMPDPVTDKDGKTTNQYYVTVRLNNFLKEIKEYQVPRRDYSLLDEGDNIMVKTRRGSYVGFERVR